MPWLFDLVPFASFRNKRILEVGCGAGYDALEFCRAGALYRGIDLTPENPLRARLHLGFYGYTPDILQGDAENLSFADDAFDAYYSNGVLHHTPDMPAALREAKRVLRAGGDLWLIVYNKSSIVYWLTLFLTEHILRLGFLRRTFQERLAMVENAGQSSRVLVVPYTRTGLREVMQQAGFTVEAIWARKLTWEDLPSLPRSARLWRSIPQAWLDRLGSLFGWYLIAWARKP